MSDIIVPVEELKYDDLDTSEKKLVDLARNACRTAYAPYSHFSVGAAIELDNGEIVTGSNQENISTPLGTCAERTASFYAHATYPDAKMLTIAIAAIGTNGQEVDDPVTPCGGCRQVLAEWERIAKHDMKVILCGRERILRLPNVRSLLPLCFTEF